MRAEELIREVEAVGGSLSLRDDRLHYQLPAQAAPILPKLKAHRDEVLAELRRRHPISASAPSDKCPRLPRGVRLLRFEPKPAPVAIDICSIVVDVGLFIRRELEELNARLHSPVQIRGGWGVFTILDRLRQAGVELALEPSINKEPQPNPASAQKISQGDFGTLQGDGDSR